MHTKIEDLDFKISVQHGFKNNIYNLIQIKNSIHRLAINRDDAKDIWHASDASDALDHVLHYYEKPEADKDKKTQAFIISLAVAAGNIYHLLLGDPQPIMAIGVDSLGTHWRLSKNVEQFKDWSRCVEDKKEGLFIYGSSLISGSHYVKEQTRTLAITKLTDILMASLFLNDVDLNPSNFGLTRQGNQLIAVKIDPEFSFYKSFDTDTLQTVKDKLTYYLIDDFHSPELWENLSDNAGQFGYCLLQLVHSEVAHKEKMAFLEKLTTMTNSITHILIDQIIANTPYLNALKNNLIEATQKRIEYFKTAYESIKNKPFESLFELNYSGEIFSPISEEDINEMRSFQDEESVDDEDSKWCDSDVLNCSELKRHKSQEAPHITHHYASETYSPQFFSASQSVTAQEDVVAMRFNI